MAENTASYEEVLEELENRHAVLGLTSLSLDLTPSEEYPHRKSWWVSWGGPILEIGRGLDEVKTELDQILS